MCESCTDAVYEEKKKLEAERDEAQGQVTIARHERDFFAERMNRYREALEAMVEQFGFHRVHNGLVNDEREAIRNAEALLKEAKK